MSGVYTLHDIKTDRGAVDPKQISMSVYFVNPYDRIEAVTFVGWEPDNYLIDLMYCAIELETFLNQNQEALSRSSVYRSMKQHGKHKSNIAIRLGGHRADGHSNLRTPR